MKKHVEQIRSMVTIIASLVCGGLAGAAAGWIIDDIPTTVHTAEVPVEHASSSSYLIEPQVTLVPVDRTTGEPLVPPAFTERRSSAIATLYQKPSGDILERSLVLGLAVSVTSDGWFVTPANVLDDRELNDVVLWYDGVAATATQATVDHRGSVLFLKTNLQTVVAPAFARFQEVTRGLATWVEYYPGSFEPRMITALDDGVESLNGVSSDFADRRPVINGAMPSGSLGAAVWSVDGSLIGLVASSTREESTYIPVNAWAPSLFGIFSDGVVRHATLGVRAIDLSHIRLLDGANTPSRGALIIGDAQSHLPAVESNTPAERAGVKEGDVILQVDHDILDGRADLAEILIQFRPNATVTLTIERNGEQLEVPVTLGSKEMSEPYHTR